MSRKAQALPLFAADAKVLVDHLRASCAGAVDGDAAHAHPDEVPAADGAPRAGGAPQAVFHCSYARAGAYSPGPRFQLIDEFVLLVR